MKRHCSRMASRINGPGLADEIRNSSRSEYIFKMCTSLLSSCQEQGKMRLFELTQAINSSLAPHTLPYQLAEIEPILRELQGENRLMYDETNGKYYMFRLLSNCFPHGR